MAKTAEQVYCQRMSALEKANYVRVSNAATFRRTRESGDMAVSMRAVAEILRHGDFRGPLGTATVERLLRHGIYYMGARKAQVIAKEAGLGASRVLRSTTVRQRHVLARVLDERAAVIVQTRAWGRRSS